MQNEEFGPVCRYKDGQSHTCNSPEELAKFDKDGWRDKPSKESKTPVQEHPKGKVKE